MLLNLFFMPLVCLFFILLEDRGAAGVSPTLSLADLSGV
jgi:hypothetical protein